MDFIENIFGTAAGLYGQKLQFDAQTKLAQLQLNQANAAATKSADDAEAARRAATGQWIPGVSNTTLLVGGGVILAGVVALALLRKS